jgi:hypothetical protein
MGDDTLSKLADIELPAPPHWRPWLTGLAVAFAAITAAAWLGLTLWRRRRTAAVSAPQRALMQIDRLLQDWRRGHLDDRAASYHLAALLRLGLGLAQLDVHCPAAVPDKRQWGRTVAALQRQRYEAAPTAALQEEEFARAKAWIAAAAAQPPSVPAYPP